MAATKKAGIQFYAKIDTNRDLIGKASEFTAEVIVDADGSVLTDSSANASIGSFSEVGSTGIYRAPITLTDEGDYTVSVKWTDGNDSNNTEYIPFPVEVRAADMSDIKDLIDALQTDMTSVKDQVDTLDEAELNNIAEQVTSVQSTVNNIKKLVDDSAFASFTIDSDETANISVNDTIHGDTSGATGVVTSITSTDITVKLVTGTFQDGEKITEAVGTGIIGSIVLGSSTVNSVMEFVQAINDALDDGGSGLSALEGYTDNIELMLEGKAYTDTQGNSVTEADSKGLAEIFAEIVSNGNDIATANTAITDLDGDVSNFRTSVEGLIGTASDDATADTLFGKIRAGRESIEAKADAIKTVVDANKSTLEDAGYGLSALKDLIDTVDTVLDGLVADWADGGRLEVRFDNLDTAVSDVNDAVANAKSAIQTDIANLSTSLDNKYSDLSDKLDNISGAQQYKGFV